MCKNFIREVPHHIIYIFLIKPTFDILFLKQQIKINIYKNI